MDRIVCELLEDFGPSFINGANLFNVLNENVSFVEKYLAKVDNCSNDVEKQIMYRQLGAIVFSCIELLLKMFLILINNRCLDSKCSKECCYRKYQTQEDIRNANIIDVLSYLNDVRLLRTTPLDFDRIDRLREIRNYVHLINFLGNNIIFSKEYIDELLDIFFDFLCQFSTCDWYLGLNSCLKDLDSDGYEFTKQQNDKELKSFYTFKILMLFDKLFYNNTLTEEERRILKKIGNKKRIDNNEISAFFSKEVYFASIRFRDDNKYKTAITNFVSKIEDIAGKNASLVETLKMKLEEVIKRQSL